jgi:hypothetical protein
MKYLLGFVFLFLVIKANANRFSNSDDAIMYGGAILVLVLLLGIVILSGFIRRKIREYKRKVTDES